MSLTKKRGRGYILGVVLMLSVLLLIVGIGFIGSKASLYQGAGLSGAQAQAQALAEAGLEDVRLKLDKDPNFPPAGGIDQVVYAYSENVLDSSGTLVGFYEIQLDYSHRVYPFGVLKIKSIGRVGPRNDPSTQHTISAELDVSSADRNDPTLANPRNFQFHRWNSSKNS